MDLAVTEYSTRTMSAAVEGRHATTCLFELTPTCNLRCHFCYVALDPYRGPYLTTEEAGRILEMLADAGVLWLTLTGGEIFSRRDFPEIYRRAKELGFMVTLYTNATLVTERHARLLAELPPHSVEVSIYGADAEHYESTTGIPGSFARFERGVSLLQRAGVNMVLKHPASSLTADHVPAVRDWCAARGLPHKFSFEIENRHSGGQEPSVYRIQPRKVKALRDELRMLTGTSELPLPECSIKSASDDGVERLYTCGAGRFGVFVDGLGNASHCVLDREPSFPLLELGWEETWRRIGEWVEQPLPAEAPCSGCSLREGCHNCPARARLATGSPYLKDTYHCDITHAEHGLAPAVHPDYRAMARPLGACAR